MQITDRHRFDVVLFEQVCELIVDRRQIVHLRVSGEHQPGAERPEQHAGTGTGKNLIPGIFRTIVSMVKQRDLRSQPPVLIDCCVACDISKASQWRRRQAAKIVVDERMSTVVVGDERTRSWQSPLGVKRFVPGHNGEQSSRLHSTSVTIRPTLLGVTLACCVND